MPVNRVRLVREALDLSQREFGERLGVSRDVISNIEYGRVPAKKLLLQHICEQYHVNEHWLETGEGDMFEAPLNTDHTLQEALAIFQSLRSEFQKYALDQIKSLVELQNQN